MRFPNALNGGVEVTSGEENAIDVAVFRRALSGVAITLISEPMVKPKPCAPSVLYDVDNSMRREGKAHKE